VWPQMLVHDVDASHKFFPGFGSQVEHPIGAACGFAAGTATAAPAKSVRSKNFIMFFSKYLKWMKRFPVGYRRLVQLDIIYRVPGKPPTDHPTMIRDGP